MTQQDKTYEGTLPFEEVVVYPSQEQQREAAARRTELATEPHYDFSKVQDITPLQRKWYNIKGKGLLGFYTKPANCINSATYWITNDSTIAKNKSLVDTPQKFGYTPITRNEAQRGDLIQYTDGNDQPYHAGVVLQNDGNTTLVRSSSGESWLNPIRRYNSDGVDIDDRMGANIGGANYYRYNYPNSGVYFRINGKLIKKQGGILGLSNKLLGFNIN